MINPIDDLADQILRHHIDKREAVKSFESLSEEGKQQLIALLKQRLPDRGAGPVRERAAAGHPGLPNLKALDQGDLTDGHRQFIEQLSTEYAQRVPASKANVMKYQDRFVDQQRPFRLIKELKDLHFQLSYRSAEGAHVRDADGNRYVDISGDMGVNIFGHKPPFLVEAIKQALDRGIPLSGHSESTFEAAKLFCEITGHERMLFTQSGAEAVIWAVRIARAATQRKKIVLFGESDHGLSDAVPAARDDAGLSHSAVPGVLEEFAEQIIVLEYGNMRHLDAIEERAGEIACVLVEPVQSRHPCRKPVEFLHEVRKLTLEKDIALIFDERITGFRVCPKGAQGHFGIQADLATYGEIPGGGMPTGIVAGLARYMDLVDCGSWNFGDGSLPKANRTSVAGTHIQNPLKAAAVLASLTEIKDRCADAGNCDACTCFQKDLNRKTRELAEELDGFFAARRLPITIDYFGSLFRFRFLNGYWGITEALFFLLLRMNGVETHIQGHCFLTTAHGEEDIRAVIKGVQDSLARLLEAGFFTEAPAVAEAVGEKAGPAPGLPGPAGPRGPAGPEPERIQVKVARSLTEEQMALLRNLIKADLQGFQKERR